jgi:predicted DCC family thiol-disulfide oxidoreductase YuxK
MNHLRRLKRDTLQLIDIHTLDNNETLPPREQLLEVLHLRRGDQWLTGADASVAAWQHTAYGALWRWLRWPLIAPIVDRVYERWAVWRYERLYGAVSRCGDQCN